MFNRHDKDQENKMLLQGALCGTALGIIFTSLPTVERSDSVIINLLTAIVLVVGAPILTFLLTAGGAIVSKFLCYEASDLKEKPSKIRIALLAVALIAFVYLRIIGEL